jgi:hypothetical protein
MAAARLAQEGRLSLEQDATLRRELLGDRAECGEEPSHRDLTDTRWRTAASLRPDL